MSNDPNPCDAYRLIDRQASVALTCVKNLPCTENDADYKFWLLSVGTAEAVNYLCTDNARRGKTYSIPSDVKYDCNHHHHSGFSIAGVWASKRPKISAHTPKF